MTTIGEAIDYVRHEIKETSDDSHYTDQFIYETLLKHRNVLLHNYLVKQKSNNNELLWQGFCMPLCVSTWHDCDDCVPNLGCAILKSKYPLPNYLYTSDRSFIEVTNLTGSVTYPKTSPNIGKYRAYRRTQNTEEYYSIKNNYLFFVNNKNNIRVVVYIRMILEDPTQLTLYPICDESGIESNTCYEVRDLSFNLKPELFSKMLSLTKEELLAASLRLPEDNNNNADSDSSLKTAQ